MFQYESNLVRQLVAELRAGRSPWGGVRVSREFSYQRGRTDVLALGKDDGRLIAFEAKIANWRQALHQAYRYTTFAHRSYVVVPRKTSEKAQRYSGEFTKRNVGLCYIQAGKIVIVLSPEDQHPIEPWLFEEAVATFRSRTREAPRFRGCS